MATGRKPNDAPPGEIPDLDIAPRQSGAPSRVSGRPSGVAAPPKAVPSAAPPSGRVVSSPPANPADYFGSGTFDADRFDGSDVSIKIETSEDGEPGSDPAAYFGAAGVSLGGGDPDDFDAFEDSRANAQRMTSSRAPASRAPKRKWPSGRSPDPAGLRIESIDVGRTADFGELPSNALLTPLYALRVLRRKRELGRAVKDLLSRFDQAERERNALLARLTQELRGQILSREGGDELFAPVVALEKVALERRDGLASTNEEHARGVEAFASEATALAREVANNANATTALAKRAQELGVAFDRAEAKKKRLYIELRGLVEASEKPGATLSSAQSARITELEGLIAAQKSEHETAHSAQEAATAAVRASEAAGEQIQRRQRDLDRRRYAFEEQFRKQYGARSEEVSSADAGRKRALADVARGVLAARGELVDVTKETLDAIERADELVHQRALELEKHVRASRDYDEGAVKTGLAIVAITLVVLVVLVITLT